MASIEIVLLVCGIICIVVSFLFNFGDKVKTEENITTTLTNEQKEKIKKQITDIIDEELENLNEKTEASLDKISNTKILELNDYAENILGQINRNHNETVFLYDMLNEKAKEVKNTVRDVNATKKQVERMQLANEAAADEKTVDEKGTDVTIAENKEAISSEDNLDGNVEVKDAARERLAELVRKSNEKSKKQVSAKKDQAEELDKITAVQENDAENIETKKTRKTTNKTSTKTTSKTGTTRKTSTARKTSTTRKTAAKEKEVQQIPQEAANMNIQFEKGANNNDKILKLYNMGISNKEIAKQLNLGVGEVKLVIDLYKGGK